MIDVSRQSPFAALTTPKREVAIIVYQGVTLLDVSGPAQVFASANRVMGRDVYGLRYASPLGGLVMSQAGLALMSEPFAAVDPASVDTLILPGGPDEPDGLPALLANADAISWLKSAVWAVRRPCSVCSGAFLLAATGALDGKRAATHWDSCQRLRSSFPNVEVDPASLFVRDGDVWSSAGIAAGIDLALALVEADLGRQIAIDVAQYMVVYAKRPGTQSQFSRPLAIEAAGDARLERMAQWVETHLSKNLDVDMLAAFAGMSQRSLHRHMRAKLGMTPARFVESIRLDAARRMLDGAGAPLARIAAETGFSSPDHLIRAFERRFGVTPGVYRKLHLSAA
jgi:transcriptional regulator GlxA family with amidase domain